MTTALTCLGAMFAILIILAFLGYAEMTRSAKSSPDHWFHS